MNDEFHPAGGPREEPPIVHDDAVLDEARREGGQPFGLLRRLKEQDKGILTGAGHLAVMEALEDRLTHLEELVEEMGRDPDDVD